MQATSQPSTPLPSTSLPSTSLPSTSTPAPPNPDNLKDKILTTLGGDDPVIMAFSNLSLDDIKSNVDKLIRDAVHDKSPEIRKHALQQINMTLQEVNVNPARVKMLLGILSRAVQDGVLSGREVCECLKELLNTDIESLSMELLNFFDVLIGCTDHKICQEIFTNCLQETSKLPSVLTGSHHRISNKINAMLTKLLDRDNLVMPPICSYCDIMIAFNKPNVFPHWSVSELLNDYVSTFNCLTDLMTIENTEHFRPVIRHSFHTPTGWKLDQTLLSFHTVNPSYFILQFSGPYSKPQTDLMLYTLKQVSCRDFVVNTMLQLRQGKGTICPVLEKVFMKLLKQTAAASEKDHDLNKMKVWERFGGELSSLIFCSSIHIKDITEALLKELKEPATFSSLQQHRDFLMWMLHRCFSFCLKIVRIPKKDFLFIGDIIKLLYPELAPLPVPDRNSPLCVVYLSAASLWAVFGTRSVDNPGLQDSPPLALIEQLNFLHMPQLNQHQFSTSDYSVCVSLNHINNFVPSFSNNSEAYSRPLRFLMESVYMAQQTTVLPGNVQVVAALTPIPLDILDMLTAHAKLNFIVTITNHITKMADPHDQMTQSSTAYLAPALLETFSRLLCYTEIDSNSLKMMMTLIHQVSNYHAFGILCSLMEMFIHRMQFVKQTNHRMTMLTHFQTLYVLFTLRAGNHPQMLYMLESFTMRLLPLLNYQDHTRISSSPSGIKILSTSVEELNKLFILSAARNAVVSGNKAATNSWLKPFMEYMIQCTPAVREWSPYTLTYFPQSFKGYVGSEVPVVYPAKNLAMMVTEEINRTMQAGAKHDFVKYYKESDHNEIFLCILLRKVIDSDTLPNYALKVTQNWTPAALKNQIRNMIDFIVLEVKNNKGTSQNIFNKIANAVNDFVFRHHMMPFDTLIFILALRKYSDQDANISLYLIHNLLVGKTQFSARCADFVQHASPDYWRSIDWSHVHSAYHNKFPEHQYWMKKDNFAERGSGSFILPTYYSNLCLRFLPILDVVIHRLIELPPKNCRKWLVEILRVYSRLFAYHDSPITFLHDTLFYYDVMLATEFDFEKRVLVRSYLEHLTCKPMEFLSPQFIKYLNAGENDPQNWSPSPGYFLELVNNMNDVVKSSDGPEFSHIDWRFNEFGNPVCMMLYLVSIELMCIPLPATKMSAEYLAEHRINIGSKLVDIVLNNNTGHLPELCNTLGILLSALPVSFSKAVYRKIVEILRDGSNFYEVEGNIGGVLWNNKAQNVLILVHSFFQHCKTDKIGFLPEFITQNLNLFTTESHVVYILKLVSPFLCHLFRSPSVRNQTLCSLYQVMINLLSDNTVTNPDLFVDYMYYIKYIYAGAEFKPLIEKHLPTLPADISSKLKFLVIGTDSAS